MDMKDVEKLFNQEMMDGPSQEELDKAGKNAFRIYASFVKAAFTCSQAMDLVKNILKIALERGMRP